MGVRKRARGRDGERGGGDSTGGVMDEVATGLGGRGVVVWLYMRKGCTFILYDICLRLGFMFNR